MADHSLSTNDFGSYDFDPLFVSQLREDDAALLQKLRESVRPADRVDDESNVFFSSRRRHTRCLSDWSSDVCSSDLISCMLRGGYEILDHCKKKLGIGHKQVTPDGQFSLEEVECIGACC